MKKQTEELRKEYFFFDDEDGKKDVKIKSDTEMDNIETTLYASPKRENDIDASPRKESKDEIDKKYIRNQNLKLQLRLKNKLQRNKKFIKSELEQDKVDL